MQDAVIQGIIMSGQYSRPKIGKRTYPARDGRPERTVDTCQFKINPDGSKTDEEPITIVVENHPVIPWITSGRRVRVRGKLAWRPNDSEKDGKKHVYANPRVYARRIVFMDSQPMKAMERTLKLMKGADLINEDQYNSYHKRLSEVINANFDRGRSFDAEAKPSQEVEVPPEQQNDDDPF